MCHSTVSFRGQRSGSQILHSLLVCGKGLPPYATHTPNKTMSVLNATGLIANRRLLMGLLLAFTLVMVVPMAKLKMDSSGVSFHGTDDAAHLAEDRSYRAFIDSFGTDDYILLAVENTLGVSDPGLTARINYIHGQLAAMDGVLKVIDLETIRSSDLFRAVLPPRTSSEQAFFQAIKIVPGLSRLISTDMKTLAFVIKVDNEILNGFHLERRVKQMKQIILTAFPEQSRCYGAGIPVLRAAFERYNLVSALVFGCLGLVFGVLIAFYLFKTLGAALMVLMSSLCAMVWTLGTMGALGIPINLATGLGFGFILVVSTTTVFHVVSAYFQSGKTRRPDLAMIQTLEKTLVPCFMCALTTSAGFLSLTLSPVEMVRQAGVIISLGVVVAFVLTIVIVCFWVPRLFDPGSNDPGNWIENKTTHDLLDRVITQYAVVGFKRPVLCLVGGMVFLVAMIAGIGKIETIKHLTHSLIKNTSESRDLEFIGQRLSTGYSFSIVLEPFDDPFKSRKVWYDMFEFERKIKTIPGVENVESLTTLVFHLALKLSPAGVMPEFVFQQMAAQSRAKDLVRTYFDPGLKKLRLVVHIQNQSSDQIETILGQVKAQADEQFSTTGQVELQGQLIRLKSQTTQLVSSQLFSLVPALTVITLLMMIQLGSPILGGLSLIPNIFPLATIFGTMGWLHIALDPLTIFAAVISFGLSVDDSIHYLTQVKTEILGSDSGTNVAVCLKRAYDKTARALVSTTAVLFLSASGLLFSSFTHVFSLGVLICLASISALVADIVFMPAVIVLFNPLERYRRRQLNG
ncbi:putative membrane protein (RND exporter superfamily) [Desulforapulum autotrophicum HRM2]|uniref:Membrane protein (RND exporter superfamily) n=2 Tax=Desulforapulum autotrophicum TaxID=2296 RepID=C0QH18_DESAH|nr:putative membrane protein (RND exporter superfamily) [Desulforapulum autotrophicum HRM2]